MSQKRLAIIGMSGRMGREIAALAPELGFSVAGGVTSQAPIASLRATACDVVIDFSLPAVTDAVIAWCVANKKPLVSGVTGISIAQKRSLAQAGRAIPVLWSPNMSIGVAVLAKALSALSALEGFDFQIEELHHSKKKDKPSGTALSLQSKLADTVEQSLPDPVAIRGGGIFGIHRVLAMGEEETLCFEHTAMNRRVFARGALRAAEWLLSKPAGHYEMSDVLSGP